MKETLYLLDGHAQMYRAYYAPFRDLTSPSGEPTRATHVFFTMLFNLMRTRKPTYLAMAIDLADSIKGRQEVYPEYKTNREPPPDDLYPQIDRIISTLQAMRLPILSVAGFEADDVLATLAGRFENSDLEVFLVSRDKDLEQLIRDNVKLYDPGKDEIIDTESLRADKGYQPKDAIEIQTLAGDSVDNIPGVPGVGVKTAAKLIRQYGTADAVLEHADELTPKMRQNVLAFAEQMPVTRELVTLCRDVPLEFDLETAKFKGPPVDVLKPIFQELGLNRLQAILEKMEANSKPNEPRALARAGLQEGGSVLSVSETAQDKSCGSFSAHYVLVDTTPKLKSFLNKLKEQKIFALDTETTSLNPIEARLAGISISWQAGEGYYLPVLAAMGQTLPVEQVIEALGSVFADPKIKKCGHNLKYDLIVLQELGMTVQGVVFDSMIASLLLDPLRRSHSMDSLAKELYDHTMIPISDLIGKGKKQITIDQCDTQSVCEYAAEDADYTWRFYESMQPEIDRAAFKNLFDETEMPLVAVLTQMERNGVALDVPLLSRMSTDLEERLNGLSKEIHQAAGHPFNIESPKQLAEVLFDEQGLRVVRKTKTGRSTDAETLAALSYETNNPLPVLILQYRELAKLKSTYVDSLPKMVCKKTGRVHASFNLIGTVTGRLSSSDPNLQNIPIRTEEGRQVRKAFITSSPDHVLLTADYSQIELRLLAHFCQDRALVSAFQNDQDIHRFVASEVFNVPLEEVTPEQRGRAKAVNFGIIYGQTAYGLSRTTGMAVGEAQSFIDLYFLRYPGIRLFIDECIARVKREGVATTLLGRQRPIPELRSKNKQQRMLGERLAVNTVLQGSAAELIKRAMINIHHRICQDADGVKMLIQVHDELVFEVHEDSAADEADKIQEEMVSALPLNVPLKVDVYWGPNWLESKGG